MGTEKTKSFGNSTTAVADTNSKSLSFVPDFFELVGITPSIPPQFDTKGFFSDFIRGLLKVDHIDRGHVSVILSVKPPVVNFYGGLHGGAVAAVAEVVSIACARTVVGKDKELFLGELSTTYLSAAPPNADLKVDASVLRSGRNLTVVALEFKLKDSGHLAYTSRATFYNLPVASL
ncbi:hypothetical protein U1Q18_023509 [Sarracenia purpurea var. burkii]